MPTESGSYKNNRNNNNNNINKSNNNNNRRGRSNSQSSNNGATNNSQSNSRRHVGGQDASHLLNFHTTTNHEGLLSQHSRIRRKNNHKKKNKDRESAAEQRTRRNLSSKFFLHSSRSHGFVLDHHSGDTVHSNSNGRYAGPDEAIPWSAVRAVRCLVETSLEEEDPSHVVSNSNNNNVCPICLDQFVCPRIGKCGHAFCLSCIMRHLVENSKDDKSSGKSKNVFMNKCPCCATLMSLEELRPVHFVTVGNTKNKKKKMHFTKLHRVKGCFAPYLPNNNNNNNNNNTTSSSHHHPHKYIGPNAAPSVLDTDAKFSRFNYLDHDASWYYQQIIQTDIHSLQTEIKCTSPQDQTTRMYLNMALQSIQYDPTQLRLQQEHPQSKTQPQTNVHDVKEPSTTKVEKRNHNNYLQPDCTHFYQSSDGQLCFLSGFNMHCLSFDYSALYPTTTNITDCNDLVQHQNGVLVNNELSTEDGNRAYNHEITVDASLMEEVEGNVATTIPIPAFPDFLEGQIIDTENVHLTPEVRKRMPFLSHLPLYTDITFVELDLNKYLSKGTRDKLKPEMEQRKKKRNSKKNAEKRANQLARKQEEQRIQKLKNSSQYQRIDPNDEFFHSMTQSLPNNSTASPLADEFGPSLTTATIHAQSSSHNNRPNTQSNHQQRTLHRPNTSAPMNFRSVCTQSRAYPSLISTSNANAFPALSSSKTITNSTMTNNNSSTTGNIDGSAWGSNAKGGIKSPKSTGTASSPMTGKKKGKGKKIVLFSTGGGGRGTN